MSNIHESDARQLRDNLSKFGDEFGPSDVQRKLIMGYWRACMALDEAAASGYILNTDKLWRFKKKTKQEDSDD